MRWRNAERSYRGSDRLWQIAKAGYLFHDQHGTRKVGNVAVC